MADPFTVDVGGVSLSVIDEGSGPAVLLLHGFPDRASMWSRQIAHLVAQGFRVIAPDLRGYGDSDKPVGVENYRMHLLVGDVTGLLDALGVEKAHVVGHDWGASLAWNVAAAVPERVERLVVLSVGHPRGFFTDPRQRQRSWYMLFFGYPGVAEATFPRDDWAYWRQFGWGGATTPEAEAHCRRQVADLSREGAFTAALEWYRANFPPELFVDDRRMRLPAVHGPVLGIWGDRDMALTEAQMTSSADAVDGEFRYERLPGVGHWIATEAPDRLDELLTEFLTQAEAQP